MVTIKSFTSLKQSKKLAEILPLESADMYWMHGKLDNVKQHPTPNIIGNDHDEPLWNDYDIPCWSLGALLGVLPDCLSYEDGIVYPTLNIWEYSIEYSNAANKTLYRTKEYDNLVDACYEMILKLNELNLL